MLKTIFLAGLYLLLSLKVVFADEVFDLERIVVTGSRFGESYADKTRVVDVIYQEEIEEAGVYNLAQILSRKASIDISDRGFLGASKEIRMRGLEEKQILVLIDGRPLNNPRNGSMDLGTVNLDMIERIEVLHGPGSNLYGSSAMGGVVNIITKNIPKDKPVTTLIYKFGTFRTYEESVFHGYRKDKFGYLVNYDFQKSEGYRDNAEFKANDVWLKLAYDFNRDNNLSLKSGYYESETGLPGSITSPDLDDKESVIKKFVDLDYNLTIDETKRLKLKAYENYERMEFIETPDPLDKDVHTTKLYGLDAQYICDIRDNYSLAAGVNRIDNSINSSTSGKHSYFINACYVENKIRFFEPLSLNLSLRVDDYSNFGTEVNPSLNILYELDKDTKFHFLIARSFGAPTFNDLYWPADGSFEGNPNLSPEKGISGELGFDSKIGNNFNLSLVIFRSDFDDLIDWAQADDDIWRPSNVNSAIINGTEARTGFFIGQNLELNISYAYLSAKDDQTKKFLIKRPEHKSDFSLKYNFPWDLSVSLHGQFVNRTYSNSSNTQFVKRYYLLDLDINKKINNSSSCFVNFNNLTDRKYQKIRNYPMPGFNVSGGLKVQF